MIFVSEFKNFEKNTQHTLASKPISITSRTTSRYSNNNFYPNHFNPRYDPIREHFQNDRLKPNFHAKELLYKQFDDNSENYTYEHVFETE